jgi:hypothetical protein
MVLSSAKAVQWVSLTKCHSLSFRSAAQSRKESALGLKQIPCAVTLRCGITRLQMLKLAHYRMLNNVACAASFEKGIY